MSEKNENLVEEIIDEEIDEGADINEEDDMIIPLMDSDGNQVDFRLIYVVEYEGDDYALLNPVVPTEEIGEDEVLIFKIVSDEEKGEDVLLPPDSEEIVEKVYEKFMQEYYAEDDCGCGCGCEDCRGCDE